MGEGTDPHFGFSFITVTLCLALIITFAWMEKLLVPVWIHEQCFLPLTLHSYLLYVAGPSG